MPGEISCTVCGRKFTLENTEPGQMVRCPYCQMKVEVPAPPEPAGSAGDWYVCTFEGERYGPITKQELDEWVRENRLTADCQVLQEGWPQWRWAREFFPALKTDMSFHKPVSTARAQPAEGAAQNAPPSGPEPHPYAAPRAAAGPAVADAAAQWAAPHRGGLILALGISSFVLSCFLLGLPAWIMAQNDLKEMRQGRMDRSGEGLTTAGMILGIIGTLFSLIPLVIILIACAGGLAFAS